MNSIVMARRAVGVARGIRRLVRDPVSLAEARAVVADEVLRRDERFLESLDALVWPFRRSPINRLLVAAGLEAGDVRQLVHQRGLVGALEHLRDLGVHVTYEEAQGRHPVVRGSTRFHVEPASFFNPIVPADYMATTGGSRSKGTPVELSFRWQRRQGVQRALQHDLLGTRGVPTAVWLPVFPSAAGYGAVMKQAAGGNTPERWFSQVPVDLAGISAHKQLANRAIPALNAMARTGLPSPEHAPTADPEPVVRWMVDAVARTGRAAIAGYATSITSAARWATDHGISLDGVVAFPASEPVTSGKLAAIRASGMQALPAYAFVPEGTVAIGCPSTADEEYHLWDQDLAVITRRRDRGDGTQVDAFCWTSLAVEAPRVLVNVENDDFGRLHHDVSCDCPLGALGLRTHLADIRGMSKVVTGGISIDGATFDHLCEDVLPARLGGGPGDYQFVEDDTGGATVIELRIRPDVGAVDEDLALRLVRDAIEQDEFGVLASSVWGDDGHVRIARRDPHVTRAGKTLAYERLSPTTRADTAP